MLGRGVFPAALGRPPFDLIGLERLALRGSGTIGLRKCAFAWRKSSGNSDPVYAQDACSWGQGRARGICGNAGTTAISLATKLIEDCLTGELPDLDALTKVVDLPVCYDEEFALDLREAAERCGLTSADVVARHSR